MMVCTEGQRIQVKMSAGPLPKFKNWQYLHKSNKNGKKKKKKSNTYCLAVTNYVVIIYYSSCMILFSFGFQRSLQYRS